MKLYDRYLLPKIIRYTCSQRPQMRQREKVIPLASGRVLEIGVGGGLNIPFYDSDKVESLIGIDPSPELLDMAREASRACPFAVELKEASAEQLPLDDNTIDTVVVTYTLCTIPDATAALAEFRRVLKPGGRLIFCEHGRAPDPGVLRTQRFLGPLWKRLGGGCNLDRDIPALIKSAGFELPDHETMYLPGWRFASFNFWGIAKAPD